MQIGVRVEDMGKLGACSGRISPESAGENAGLGKGRALRQAGSL